MKRFKFLLLLLAILFVDNMVSQTWSQISTGATNALYSVHFASQTHGWAAGASNNIRATTDGGNTWTGQTTGLSSMVVWNGIYFTSTTNGCVVGPGTILCITSNGGTTWTQVNSGTPYVLNSVHFPSSSNGYAVGAGGVIIATTNGGTSWTTKVAGSVSNSDLRSVYFASTTVGWITGNNGVIRKTTDGGNTWVNQTSGTTQTLYDCFFTSTTQGWAVGANGTILVTSNGGTTWTAQSSGTTSGLRSVHFVSSTQGWIVTEDGSLLVTSNAGTNWVTQTVSPTFNVPLYAIFMNSSTLGWAVGAVGTSIKFCSAPAQPGVISGSTTVCSGSSQTYSVAAVAGASSYTWTFPAGWTGTSTTNSISVVPSSAGAGTVTVKANNGTCVSSVRTLNVTVNASPAQPGTINGNSSPCSSTSQTYSVSAVSGASSYTWTLPSGWTGSSTTNSISSVPNTTSGNISVRANGSNGCNSQLRTLAVTPIATLATLGSISGSASVCSALSQTYSVAPLAGATAYTWTLPSGWTGTSTTNTINSTVGNSSGNITVNASNTCGSSNTSTLAITVNTIPGTPSSINGATSFCVGGSQSYSVAAVAGATSYVWSFPSGWTGTSTTNSVTVSPSNSSGLISVIANNSCGSSAAQNLSVNVNSAPVSPAAISGAPSNCTDLTYTYSVTPVVGATTYNWTLPSGYTGTSTTNSISINTGSSVGGMLTVSAQNTCGSSATTNLFIDTYQTPTLFGNGTSICSGDIAQLEASPSAGDVMWFTSTTGGTALDTGLIYTTPQLFNNTTYYAEANNNGCISTPRLNFDVIVTPYPNVNVVNVANTLTVAESNGIIYQWLDCSNSYSTISGETNQSFSPLVNGSFAVLVNLGGCVDTSACEVINSIGLTDNVIDNTITVYPNPFVEVITIDYGLSENLVEIQITNVAGAVVFNEERKINRRLELKTDLNSGVYFVKLKNKQSENFKVFKVVKQ